MLPGLWDLFLSPYLQPCHRLCHKLTKLTELNINLQWSKPIADKSGIVMYQSSFGMACPSWIQVSYSEESFITKPVGGQIQSQKGFSSRTSTVVAPINEKRSNFTFLKCLGRNTCNIELDNERQHFNTTMIQLLLCEFSSSIAQLPAKYLSSSVQQIMNPPSFLLIFNRITRQKYGIYFQNVSLCTMNSQSHRLNNTHE